MPTVKSVVLALTCITLPAIAGNVSWAQGGDPHTAFAPLTVVPTLGSAPSQTRLANGAPGPKYWQNRADYDLKATLDTATHTLRGSMTLRYTNNSPDELSTMWFQTEQKSEVIDKFDQIVGAKPVALTHQHAGSDVLETQVTLAEPLKPGKTATFQVEWHFTVPKTAARMGRDGALYEIGQWYPRPNVYDDVKGWNTESYATGAEFFLEYGDYTMEVTLPAGYIVAATGTLDNPKDVLTSTEITRLAQAAKSDTVVFIVTAQELQNGSARPTKDGMLTWKFHAKNVRDAVWCASPDYQWDATSWHGIITQSYYRSSAPQFWRSVADMLRVSIQEYSERWFPYPYPQASSAEGEVYGMEYPMLSMDGHDATEEDTYDTITHETGHDWFPMIVGSNERMHTWQDEGFNQFINTFSNARRYPQAGDQDKRGESYVQSIEKMVAGGQNRALETGKVIGNVGGQYNKTAGVLQMLRRDVLGPELFDKAFKAYIQRWAYKHPTPMDFFRTMSDVSGQKLDWFWREWFLEAPKFDQSIDSVSSTMSGKDTKLAVLYGNKADGVLPLLVRFTFGDGTTQDFKYPADVWATDGKTYKVSYSFSGKSVTKIVIDPDSHLVDVDRANNSWAAK